MTTSDESVAAWADADPAARTRADAAAWAARAPRVPEEWFAREVARSSERGSSLHGVCHTQRVHIHAQRLTRELGWAELDAQLALKATLWHDIGRTNDGEDDGHGAQSAARAAQLGLTVALAPADAGAVLFAIFFHCLPDETAREEAPRWHQERGGRGAGRLPDPEQALRILWLLKDADALDRVRLGPWEAADPRQFRHAEAAAHLPFAAALFDLLD
ncbi:MAG TPA: HD domain-containing protein [Thermoleophilia bacterium]|nr:HD domain-containing protein [Thermoleophilia bacterium]